MLLIVLDLHVALKTFAVADPNITKTPSRTLLRGRRNFPADSFAMQGGPLL